MGISKEEEKEKGKRHSCPIEEQAGQLLDIVKAKRYKVRIMRMIYRVRRCIVLIRCQSRGMLRGGSEDTTVAESVLEDGLFDSCEYQSNLVVSASYL